MNRYSVDLTLELLSPCFLGGAFQQPEFRIASLRGIWRYWYRALYGQGNEDGPGEDERRIFGGVGLEGDSDRRQPRDVAGRGRARLVLRESTRGLKGSEWNPLRAPSGHSRRQKPPGAEYLLFSMGMRNKRFHLDADQAIRLSLILDSAGEDQERALRSLAAACAFSGLGARSRHMGGALSLRAAQPAGPIATGAAESPEVLAARLRALIGSRAERSIAEPGYHVVAKGVFRAGVLRSSFATWREALDSVGDAVRSFRERYEPDYTIALRAEQGQAPGEAETIRRAAFGLPIQFRFPALQGRGPNVQLDVREPNSRRGSPLSLTLERLGDVRRPVAVVWCLFRSPLTPNARIRIGRFPAPAPDLSELSIIDEMLRRPEWASYPVAE